MKALCYIFVGFACLAAPLFATAADEHEDAELFIVLTSSNLETQMLAMVLATQSMNQNVPVRVLLCSEAGDLALQDTDSPVFQPADRSPKQLLQGLLNNGSTVEVCGIYLPNRTHLSANDLLEGINEAAPPEVARYMKQANVRYLSF